MSRRKFMRQEWDSFRGGIWEKEINVRDFIQKNYTPYDGMIRFLPDQQRLRKNYGRR